MKGMKDGANVKRSTGGKTKFGKVKLSGGSAKDVAKGKGSKASSSYKDM